MPLHVHHKSLLSVRTGDCLSVINTCGKTWTSDQDSLVSSPFIYHFPLQLEFCDLEYLRYLDMCC